MAIKLRYIARKPRYDPWFTLGQVYLWDGTKKDFLAAAAYGLNPVDGINALITFNNNAGMYDKIYAARFELVNDKLDPRLG